MAKINVLSQHLVNKIAAGEVVERPASVLKELLENSLDAHSTQINVEIEEGGKKMIRVSDNGSGMTGEDLALAFTPHATSKISSEDDLHAISTLGFRGEALPSIASVSQVEVISRPADAIEGSKLEISGGQAQPVVPAAASPGTNITVRNLFFNTPARRKFLRTTNTEMGHVTEQFTRIALASLPTQFSLTHNGRTMYDLPAQQSLPERISSLFSTELAENLVSVKRHDRDIKISGQVARPVFSRANAQWQYVFLNGRYIRDRFIGHALREAYRGMLEINRQPIVFLFLEIDPHSVDVNVHPTKMEVRFANSNAVHSQVLAAIRDRLLSTDLSVPLDSKTLKEDTSSVGGREPATNLSPEEQSQHQQRVRQAMADFFKKSIPQNHSTPPERFSSPSSAPSASAPQPSSSAPSIKNHPVDSLSSHRDHPSPAAAAPTSSIEPDQTDRNSNGRDFGPFLQIHDSYLVMQNKDGLLIIDQHALHERILYEKLNQQLQNGPLESQRSLIPEVIDVTPAQMAVIENESATLAELGILVEPFGPRSIAVQGFPVLLDKASPTALVSDLLDVFTTRAGSVSREELMHHVLDMMACKAAVKAGDHLNETEIKALVSQRHLVERSDNCPHGRPTTIRLSLSDLEKQFKRT